MKWRGIGKKRLRRNTFDLLPGIPTDPERSSIDGDGRKHTHTHRNTHTQRNTHTHTRTHTQTHTEPINIKALKQAKERP